MGFLSRIFKKKDKPKEEIIEKKREVKFKLDEQGRRIAKEINLKFRYYSLPQRYENEMYGRTGIPMPDVYEVPVPPWYVKSIHHKYMDEEGVLTLDDDKAMEIMSFLESKGYVMPVSYIIGTVECIYEEEK